MVTLEQAKQHLRMDHHADDDAIAAMIEAATAAAADYLNMPLILIEVEQPAPVQAAILLMVGDLFMNRERQGDQAFSQNPTYERLLNPYRLMVV